MRRRALDLFGLTATGAIAEETIPGLRVAGIVHRVGGQGGFRDAGKIAAGAITIAKGAGARLIPGASRYRRQVWA